MKTKPKGKGDTGAQPLSGLTGPLCRFWEQSLDDRKYLHRASDWEAFGVP